MHACAHAHRRTQTHTRRQYACGIEVISVVMLVCDSGVWYGVVLFFFLRFAANLYVFFFFFLRFAAKLYVPVYINLEYLYILFMGILNSPVYLTSPNSPLNTQPSTFDP